jgi:hypothetical protein
MKTTDATPKTPAEKAIRNARLLAEARKVDAENAKRRETMSVTEIIDDAFDF